MNAIELPDGIANHAWVQTVTGGAVDLLDPKPEQIDFETMAIGLAGTPRFGRQTRGGLYSVAQHCLEGALAIERDTGRRDWAAAFLLHDGHEYLIGDISTPVQNALAIICRDPDALRDAFRAQKARLDAAIYPAAGIDWPLPPETAAVVHEYDARMCRTERDTRMAPSPYPWHPRIENAEPLTGVDLYPWSEKTVAALYRVALRDYGIIG
jgi:hypothetical protein